MPIITIHKLVLLIFLLSLQSSFRICNGEPYHLLHHSESTDFYLLYSSRNVIYRVPDMPTLHILNETTYIEAISSINLLKYHNASTPLLSLALKSLSMDDQTEAKINKAYVINPSDVYWNDSESIWLSGPQILNGKSCISLIQPFSNPN